jgi:DNA replication protein DnaC
LSVNAKINTSKLHIDKLLKRFKLRDMREHYESEIAYAVNNNVSHREFFVRLLEIEHLGKKKRAFEKNIKNAKFEGIKTLDEFNFKFSNDINESKIRDLATLDFIDKNENIILIGPPGVGKSHIATALGVAACEEEHKVLFAPAHELIDKLYTSYVGGNLENIFKKLSKVDLLILDEFGHFKMDKEKESIFFQLIRHRYEKNSLIITTNLPLGKWDQVFTSKLSATAVLDRLVHHCHIISISGDSYRVKGNI